VSTQSNAILVFRPLIGQLICHQKDQILFIGILSTLKTRDSDIGCPLKELSRYDRITSEKNPPQQCLRGIFTINTTGVLAEQHFSWFAATQRYYGASASF